MGDLLRVIDAVLALALAGACTFALVLARTWDARVRHGMIGAFGVLLTASHLAALGQPYSWRLPALVVVVVLALIATLAFVRRELVQRSDSEDTATRAPDPGADPGAGEP